MQIIWSQISVDCSPEPFQLQSITDKFKRLLLRFERIQQRHYGMKLMAYTLINLRVFCGA
jgi:hypothetical protein